MLVTLVDALGSTPQDAGAKMLVTPAGVLTGTVGGGKVEAKAIDLAATLLARGGILAAVRQLGAQGRCRHDLRGFGKTLFRTAHRRR